MNSDFYFRDPTGDSQSPQLSSLKRTVIITMVIIWLSIAGGTAFTTLYLSKGITTAKADLQTYMSSLLSPTPLSKTGCVINNIAATMSKDGTNGTYFYTAEDTKNHFDPPRVEFVDGLRTTLACVDGRRDTPTMGTPGGDFAELVMALAVYFKQTGVAMTQDTVTSWLALFMEAVITPSRPFFYHSDTTYVNYLLGNVSLQLGRVVTIVPDQRPAENEVQIWLDALSDPRYQGCGHVRMMMNYPDQYGLETMEALPQMLLRAVMEWLWAADFAAMQKFDIQLMAGAMEAKSVAVFSATCRNLTGVYPPRYHGSAVFMYNKVAVTEFRRSVMVPFFTSRDSRLDSSKFFNAISVLAEKQLNAILSLLGSIKNLPIYLVEATMVEES